MTVRNRCRQYDNTATPGVQGAAGPAGSGGLGGAGGFADGGTGTQAPSGGSGNPGAVAALLSAGPSGSTATSPNFLVFDQAVASLGNDWGPGRRVSVSFD